MEIKFKALFYLKQRTNELIKILFFIMIGCNFYSSLYGQSQADIQTPKIVPPSPDAEALAEYGEIPVDKSTGVPQISIPLYTIKTPRFTLPITLSYHASGIKVDEVASWVGAGWALNAGGIITRSIIGLPDDGQMGLLNNTIKHASEIQWPDDYLYISQVLNKLLDTEPDNFYYNFNNHAGGFVFGPNKKPVLIPYKPLLFNFGSTSKNFDVTDEQGNKYIFSTKENVTSSISDMSGISSWYLTQMISEDLSDTINFVYTTDATSQFSFSYNFSQTIGPGVSSSGTYMPQPVIATTSSRQFNEVRIRSIVFKGGRVDFISKDGRLDEGVVSLDSVIISNFNYMNLKYTRLKSFKLLTDYFYCTLPIPPNWTVGEADKHRLKLTGLVENDANDLNIKNYEFGYNPAVLPQVHSYAQDKWGYFNGQTQNQTLLESKNVVYSSNPPQVAVIGANSTVPPANRSISPTDAQAGILQKITYPTGGYTLFSYEGNKQEGQELAPKTTMASGIGLHTETDVKTYTPSNYMLYSGGNIFRIQLRRGNDNPTDPLPYVKIVRVSDGTVLYSATASQTDNIDQLVAVQITPDVQYQLIAVAEGGDNPTSSTLPYAIISTTYQAPTGSDLINVGGVRISFIKNYSSDGNITGTKTYKYGNYNESGGGVALTSFPDIYHFQHVLAYPLVQAAGCCLGNNNISIDDVTVDTYSNNSIYPMETLNGIPVGYPTVKIYEGDSLNNNGKSIYTYNFYKDSILLCFTGFGNGVRPVPVTWKNGDPILEQHYKNISNNQYALVQSKSYLYNLIGRNGGIGTTVGYSSDPVGFSFTSPQMSNNLVVTGLDGGSVIWTPSKFYWFDYPISTGSRVLSKEVDNAYGTDGSVVATTTNYYYDNPDHMFPTRIATTNSKGETLTKQINYPQDMVKAGMDPSGIYNSMIAFNMISPPIEIINSSNTIQLLKRTNSYGLFNSNLIEPQSVIVQNKTNNPETRLQYLNYDNKGNIQTVVKDNGPKTSYQWGYNRQYPVAMATNASINDIFYEGFEDGNGNSLTDDSRTGHYSHTGSYSKALTSLENGSYILTYWQKSSTNWTFATTPVTVSGSSYTISLNAQIDDIRFYPVTCQMTTYTYDPLIGMTSATDPNNRTTYYEYDDFGRLALVKDQDKNILKKICYNYAGQPGDCSINTDPLWTATGNLRCQTNSGGNTGYQEREEVDQNHNSTTYNQTRWVQDAYNTTACPLPAPPCTISMNYGFTNAYNSIYNNGTSVQFYMTFYSNAVMNPGTTYYVGNITGSCRPSVTRTINYSSGSQNWTITIYPSGAMDWYLNYGSTSVPAYSTIGTSTLTYNL